MIRKFRSGAAGFAMLAPALLAACSPSARPGPAGNALAVNVPVAISAAPPVKPAASPVFTLDTPVERIAADPQGRAVLDRDVPGLMADKHYPMFDDMSLSEIAILSHGRLSKTKLALVKSDLIELSCLTPVPALLPVIAPAQ